MFHIFHFLLSDMVLETVTRFREYLMPSPVRQMVLFQCYSWAGDVPPTSIRSPRAPHTHKHTSAAVRKCVWHALARARVCMQDMTRAHVKIKFKEKMVYAFQVYCSYAFLCNQYIRI